MKYYYSLFVMFSMMIFAACSSGDNENNQEEEDFFFIDKKEITISISDSQTIKVQKSKQGTIRTISDDEHVASSTIDDANNTITVRANHVGKTTIHVIFNGKEETCLVKCVSTNDFIGTTIIDYNISRSALVDSIKTLDNIRIERESEDYLLFYQSIKWYEIKVEYIFKNNKLERVWKYISPNSDVESSQMLNCMEEYFNFVEKLSSYKDQQATTTETIEVTITPYAYNYPKRGYVEYRKHDNYYKKSKKTNVGHYLMFENR